MKYDPTVHHRRSIRLKDYDYRAPGAYFVTLVTWQRECLFGEMKTDQVVLSKVGEIVEILWQRLAHDFYVDLDVWQVMPNHFHGIVWIKGEGEASAVHEAGKQPGGLTDASPLRRARGTEAGSLGAIIQSFKSLTTRKANGLRGTPGLPLWQRNYYEHIVRNEDELSAIRKYILENPTHWDADENRS